MVRWINSSMKMKKKRERKETTVLVRECFLTSNEDKVKRTTEIKQQINCELKSSAIN